MDTSIDLGRAALVVGVTLIVVVLINVIIYYSAAGKRSSQQIDLLRQAARRARNPWEPEDKALEELSRRVAALKKPDQSETEEDKLDR
jgi:hypothetical protein